MAEIKIDLKELKSKISSAVNDFSVSVKGFSDNTPAGKIVSDSSIGTDIEGIHTDVCAKNAESTCANSDVELNNVFRCFDDGLSVAIDDIDLSIDEEWMPDDDTFDRIKVKCTESSSCGLFAEKNRVDRIFRNAFK